MQLIKTIKEMRAYRNNNDQTLAFVPTMGNLHAGHCHLIECAKAHADKVVVSLFVNPLQFAEHEDFDTYPRTREADLEKLKHYDIDAVFIPEHNELFPSNPKNMAVVYTPELSAELCGVTRPHFFPGVATIIAEFFNIVQPNIAVFGKKDYQQLTIIKRMVSDLNFNITIIAGETQRDHESLALSSRNQYLSPKERQVAPRLYQILLKLVAQTKTDKQSYVELETMGLAYLEDAGFKVDYIAIRRQADLKEPNKNDQQLVILAAVTLGNTRLIDNIEVSL